MERSGKSTSKTAFRGQDITCTDEDGCAERGNNGDRAADDESFLSALFRSLSSLFPCVFVDLKNAEGIALRIHEISLPASVWDRELGQRYDAAKFLDCLRGRIEVLDFKRTDKSICARLRRRVFAGRLSKPPLDPPVSMVQYSMGSPLISENFHPKI